MKFVFTVILALISGASALAQDETFTINPDASEVRMTLNTTHEVVNGLFHILAGSAIHFDRKSQHMSGTVIVEAGSGNTGNNSRDKKMKNDILKVDRFSNISFAPTTYSGTVAPSGESMVKVSGVFTLLGVPHDLTLPMQLNVEGTKMTAKGSLVVPYVNWGLKNPSFLIWKADNDVVIKLSLVGQIAYSK